MPLTYIYLQTRPMQRELTISEVDAHGATTAAVLQLLIAVCA